MSGQIELGEDEYRKQVDESVSFIGKGVDFFMEAKARRLLELGRKYLGDPSKLTVLDAGCGVGLMHRFLSPPIGSLHGVDISRQSVESARKNNPPVNYQIYDAIRLPYSDSYFDLVFACNVLHHVPVVERKHFLEEITRVTRKQGLVVVFEHNPLNPLTRLAVSRCDFDADASLLPRSNAQRLLSSEGLDLVERAYILFFPFRSQVLERVEHGLGWMPLGAQYLVGARKP